MKPHPADANLTKINFVIFGMRGLYQGFSADRGEHGEGFYDANSDLCLELRVAVCRAPPGRHPFEE